MVGRAQGEPAPDDGAVRRSKRRAGRDHQAEPGHIREGLMVADLRQAREREAMARAPRKHLETAEGIDAAAMNAEQAMYIEPGIDPQWMIAYKLFTDDQGEYGIPYPVPIGQFHNGANALVNMRRRDGGYAWTAVAPERQAPRGTIECVSETCGDAHLGGRRKMLPSLDMLIK